MDVTITTTSADATVDIPDENDDRRVRTSSSTVCGMAYGIADALGRHDSLNMLDLVHEFPGRKGEAIFAMFGRAQLPANLLPGSSVNRLSKFLHDRFVSQLLLQLDTLDPHRGEVIPDALRRTFLKLNQDLHDTLFSSNRKHVCGFCDFEERGVWHCTLFCEEDDVCGECRQCTGRCVEAGCGSGGL